MRITALAIAVTLALSHRALADDGVHGFVAGDGQLSGRVTDGDGRAQPGAEVHIASRTTGERIIKTDRNGDYRVDLSSAPAFVYVYGELRISGTTASSEAGGGGEAIEMREAIAPAVMPKPKHRPAIPPYSAAAVDHNTWLRAWLLLDVSPSGAVTRVKLLDRPGFELDAIAVRAAFELTFDPARDRADRPVRAQVVWSFDWPPYWWLIRFENANLTRMPDEAWSLPCRQPGGMWTYLRACTPPTIANAVETPWLERRAP